LNPFHGYVSLFRKKQTFFYSNFIRFNPVGEFSPFDDAGRYEPNKQNTKRDAPVKTNRMVRVDDEHEKEWKNDVFYRLNNDME
jgi:hypothetical protein